MDTHLTYPGLGLSPIALDLGFFQLRWYSLAYLAGILLAYWLMRRMIRVAGAPMGQEATDDLLFWASLGVIFGGRLGYVLFYNLPVYLADPLAVLRVWDGGMSFHGGLLGVFLAILYVSKKHKLPWLRVHDWIAVVVPIGLGLGRLANFVNGELWGAPSNVPWAIRFVEYVGGVATLGPPRHPSQLYEALTEGLILGLLLAFLFWRTKARYYPGLLVGTFLLGYGLFRFAIEYVREPDRHLVAFAEATGLSMGQWLCVPMIVTGLVLIATAKRRRQRIVPVAGGGEVA